MARGRSGHGGRIHVADRETNDDAPIIGADIEITAAHRANVRETRKKAAKDKTRREHMNRINTYMEWIDVNYPEYAEKGGIVSLTEEELTDEDLFFHKNTRDLKYTGFNTTIFEAFLGIKKTKTNGATASHEQVRKFVDAVKFGSKQRNQPLPADFYVRTESYLAEFKKEVAEAKEKGNVDERASDPITTPLYRHILNWAISANCVFLWVWTVLQWNCMARAINIDPLGLHNFRRGQSDSIAVKYDSTKPDQEGEFVTEKNLYANPFEPAVCPILALGVWFCIEQQRFETTEKLFLGKEKDAEKGAAAHMYHDQLRKLIDEHAETVSQHARKDRANSHGTRKGAAIHASSGTTMPASFTSVALRGEWSISKVLDAYFKWANIGDWFLGRCLCLLNPNCSTFATLPPHWTDEGLASEEYQQAMMLCYGGILNTHSGGTFDPSGVLSMCLASIVYHSDWLTSATSEHPGHAFSQIKLLSDPDLLAKLKTCVTLEPTTDVPHATGIPPHVSQAKIINTILETVQEIKEEFGKVTETVVAAIDDAIEKRAIEAGNVTRTFVETMLKQVEKRILDRIDEMPAAAQNQDGAANPCTTIRHRSPAFNVFYPHCVPRSYKFPEAPRRRFAWDCWIRGNGFALKGANNAVVQHQIKPFREIKGSELPSEALQKELRLKWRPIMKMMEEAPGVAGTTPSNARDVTDEFVRSSYEKATEYLKKRVSYLWNNGANPDNHEISTWSKKVGRSEIEKHGNEEDKKQLPEKSSRNQPHKRKRTMSKTFKHRKIGGASTSSGSSKPVGAGGSGSIGAGGSRSIGAGGSRSIGAGDSRSTGSGGSRSVGAGNSRSTGSGGSRPTGTSKSNGCEFENVPGRRACIFPAEPGEGVSVPPLDACKCNGVNCSHVAGGCTRRFHHSCWSALEHSDERFERMPMGRFCPQCMHKICGVTWGAMAAASEPTAAAGDDEFMSSFQMDAEAQANLLNSRLSKDVEEEAKIDLEAEMAEDAAEAGRVAGGDGDGNALYVVGGKKRSGGGSSDKKKRRRGRYK